MADNARRVADLGPKTKNGGPKFMRLSKFVRFQELRVAGRGPWSRVGGLGPESGALNHERVVTGRGPWESP
jgi:hypothetical protein